MAGSKADYLENAVLGLLRGTAITPPANLYLALFTVAPTDAGGGTEVSTVGTGYARKAVPTAAGSWDAPSGGVTANTIEILFNQATLDWGTIVAWALIDTASGAGNRWYWGDVTPNKQVQALDTPRFAPGDLDITED